MPTLNELRLLQALPLELKVMRTKQRIREWVDRFGVDGVYVSFSGGKDSTVLLHIVREMYPEVEAVFADTGLEYPEIREFVKGFENVTWLRPKMRFDEVIKKYGYPFISKEVSLCLYYARKNKSVWAIEQLSGKRLHNDEVSLFNKVKYEPLLRSNFMLADKCCREIKEKPLINFNKSSHKKAILAIMAEESSRRETAWLRTGCNTFNGEQVSKPMSFWTEQDVLNYIKINNLSICPVYGDICETDTQSNLMLNGCGTKLTCSGCQRTGCVFCGFGAHLDTRNGGTSKFVRLKQTHPKLYDYCMNGGEFGADGFWIPNKQGLGMRYVIDELNKLYSKTLKNGKVKKFIEY